MDRLLDATLIEGEIGLVIDYERGKTPAIGLLQAAMGMVEALDKLDSALLSTIDTSLEPVSVLNDVKESSLKLLLARMLKKVPDEHLKNLEWKKWLGGLLVEGKYLLLQKLDADAPEIQQTINLLDNKYKSPESELMHYQTPAVSDIRDALDSVAKARASLPGQKVYVQTDYGDVVIPEIIAAPSSTDSGEISEILTNQGTEFFKVKSPDMIGTAQWTVLRNNRTVRVNMMHLKWLNSYHNREVNILPGDSLKCLFEEVISYDASGNELDRKINIIEVLDIVKPLVQMALI